MKPNLHQRRHVQIKSKLFLFLEAPFLRGFYFVKMSLEIQLPFIDFPFAAEGRQSHEK